MNIVILGAGEMGIYVADSLCKANHNVILIDKDAKALERISSYCDVATIQASVPSWKLFDNLIENQPDVFFAATGDDETNLIACAIVKNLKCIKTIARIQNKEYLNYSRLNAGRLFFVDYLISPDILAAQDLCKMLIHSGDLAVEHFAHGAIQMRTIQIPNKWAHSNLPISKLSLPPDLIAGLIRRKENGEETVLIPHGEDHILPGDQVTLVGETKMMHRLHEIFHSPEGTIHSVIIVGGSPVAIHLTHLLCQQKINVRIIEKNKARCEELAELLPNATIIHRDGSDAHTLSSEKVHTTDALISCTHSDETNLLIASLAKQLGCAKTIAQTSNEQIIPILEKLDVLPALSAKVNIVNRILSILDAETILSMTSLSCDVAKIVELKVSPSSKVIGVPLADLHLPKGVLIAVIESQGHVNIGRGDRVLRPEDVVIAICYPMHIQTLQQLLH